MNIIEFINSAAAETTGGLISASIVSLVAKLKDAFKGKSITQDALNKLIEENAEIKEIIIKLQDELIKGNIINNADKIEIKNQFNSSVINNPIFN